MDFNAENWPAARVRQTFIDHFVNAQGPKRDEGGGKVLDADGNATIVPLPHTNWPSSSVVPHKDKTLLFVNSGMCQFKDKFTGNVQKGYALDELVRACNTQKCIRAGGKHNDLDDVGKDSYHHTYFEMLGNWSFGDYFKEDAIDFAWALLTEKYGLNPERLYATYFEGSDDIKPDLEARDLWLRYLPKERVIPGNQKDNFWVMAETGPCGPCSELHYDLIEDRRNVPELVNADDPTLIEIWNLVFMQYNRIVAGGDLTLLPNKHVDTGMGFERLVAIMQGKKSNYDTDIFSAIFAKIQELAPDGIPQYQGKFGDEDVGHIDETYRVVADHTRASVFAIADGGTPSAVEAGYVIRVMIRRAVRFASEYMKVEPDFLSKLVDTIVEINGTVFTDLPEKASRIKEVIRAEEVAFLKTLKKGKGYFDRVVDGLKAKNETVIPGDVAFFLYDTLGYPLEVIQNLCDVEKFTIDRDGFSQRMEESKEKSRQAQKKKKGAGSDRLVLGIDETTYLTTTKVPVTDDSMKYKWDVSPSSKVTAIVTPEPKLIDDTATDMPEGEKMVGIVLEKTPYYAEAGGQVSDTGTIVAVDESGQTCFEMKVTSVIRFANYPLHRGKIVKGSVKLGQTITCHVDYDRRRLIAPNHTFTHVLNYALRDVLGEGVAQRGSECDPDKLRFDFSHGAQMTEEQVTKVSDICKRMLRDGIEVFVDVGNFDVAENIYGLRMDAGESYPKSVRVVSVGAPVEALLANPTNKEWYNYPVEFCGGTHLSKTSEAEAFELIEETSCSAGVRRILAITKTKAVDSRKKGDEMLKKIADAEKMSIIEAKPILADITLQMAKEPAVPLPVKMDINKRHKKLSDDLVQQLKDRDGNLLKDAKTLLMKRVESVKEEGGKKVVLELDLDGNQKMMMNVVKDDKEIAELIHGVAVMVVSKTPDGKAVRCAAKSDLGDVDVEEWAKQCCAEAAMDGVKGSARGDKGFANGTMKVKSGDASVVLSRMMEAAVKFTL